MNKANAKSVVYHFGSLADPRIDRTKRHLLLDIVVISICAVVCGAEDWVAMAQYGRAKQAWFSRFLELPNGIPSHDTFGRVFRRLDPEQFQQCFLAWIRALAPAMKGEIIAIDGKTLRRSWDRTGGKAAIHMVSAWATARRLVLGQRKVDDKSNEITAIPELLRVLALEGCIVTIDAMGCQKDIAELIIQKKGDYVLALKGNQGTLLDDVQFYFEQARKIQFKGIPYDFYKTVDGEHGRIETRRYYTVTAALRAMGRHEEEHFSHYHQVLNRATWSARALSGRLLEVLHRTFGGCVRIVVDEHLERRWGARINKRGHYRDSLASSRKRSVRTSGLRWLTMALVVRLPWTTREWALPFFSVLLTTPAVDQKLGRRHKTVVPWTGQIIAQVRRWLPKVAMTVIGDSTYSAIALGLRCAQMKVALIAPLRLDARLYAPPPSTPSRKGRPRIVGARLANLSQVLTEAQTVWQTVTVAWYGDQSKTLQSTTGTARWYHPGMTPLPIRGVLVRDQEGMLEAKAYFSTDTPYTPERIIESFVLRWTIEVTFEERRAHIGIETPWTMLPNAPIGAQHKRARTHFKYNTNFLTAYFNPPDHGADDLSPREQIGSVQPPLHLLSEGR